jgi:hypothetical protein
MSTTTTQIVNKNTRTFDLKKQPVGDNLKADLLRRGWDGTAWVGVSASNGRTKEATALFYRKPNGDFIFAL